LTAEHYKWFDNVAFLNHMRETQNELRSTAAQNQHDDEAQTYWNELLDELTRRGFNLGDL